MVSTIFFSIMGITGETQKGQKPGHAVDHG